jgi:hypothetical protein
MSLPPVTTVQSDLAEVGRDRGSGTTASDLPEKAQALGSVGGLVDGGSRRTPCARVRALRGSPERPGARCRAPDHNDAGIRLNFSSSGRRARKFVSWRSGLPRKARSRPQRVPLDQTSKEVPCQAALIAHGKVEQTELPHTLRPSMPPYSFPLPAVTTAIVQDQGPTVKTER